MPWTIEQKRAYQRAYRKNFRDDLNAERRSKYAENREQEQSYRRNWRLAHPELLSAQKSRANAARRKKYPEVRVAIQNKIRQKRIENPEIVRAWNRKAYLKNRDSILARVKKYSKENPQVATNTAHKRRAAIMRTDVGDMDEILKWMQLVKSKPDFICQYCKLEFPTAKLHFDHVVPLSRGGAHSKENLCASCSGCNHSKGAKLISEWNPK